MKVLLLLLLWTLQVTLVVLAFNAEWIQSQLFREQQLVTTYLGEDAAETLKLRSQSMYKKMFVDSGIANGSYVRLLPDKKPQHGMENLAPWFFEWLKERLDALWWLAYGGIYRLEAIAMWSVPLCPVVFAAFVDGLVARRVQRDNHQYANPVRYKAAARGVFALAFLPLVFMTLPFAVPPILLPVWLGLTAIFILTLTMHSQHRL